MVEVLFCVLVFLLLVLLFLYKENKKLKELTIVDGLTGAYNRHGFMELSEREFESFKRKKRSGEGKLSLLFIDLNKFKETNDVYGHEAGDVVLKHFAELINKTTRKRDIVGRLGGDEFVILLPDTDAHGAERITALIEEEAKRFPIKTRKGTILHASPAIGIAEATEGMVDMGSLINLGDERMYAKKKGDKRKKNTEQTLSIA